MTILVHTPARLVEERKLAAIIVDRLFAVELAAAIQQQHAEQATVVTMIATLNLVRVLAPVVHQLNSDAALAPDVRALGTIVSSALTLAAQARAKLRDAKQTTPTASALARMCATRFPASHAEAKLRA